MHLPRTISWCLHREEQADDARMIELLAPFEGHRSRVINLVMLAGETPPRRGPLR